MTFIIKIVLTCIRRLPRVGGPDRGVRVSRVVDAHVAVVLKVSTILISMLISHEAFKLYFVDPSNVSLTPKESES